MTKRLSRMWKTVNELFTGYRVRLAVLSVVGLVSGFLDGISVSLLVPLFTVFLKGGNLGSNFALQALSSALSFVHLSFSFRTLLTITALAFLLKTGALFVSGYMRGRLISAYKVSMRRRLYETFLKTSFAFVRKQKTGHLNHVIMGEVKQASRLFDDIVGLILSVGSSVMYLAIAFALSWHITVLTIILGGALIGGLFPLLKKVRRYSRELVLLGKQISHSLAETLIGIKTVKAMGVEKEVAASARTLFGMVERAEFKKYCIKLVTKLSFEPVSVAFILAVFAVSYLYFPFDIVSFIAIMYLINRVFGNINNMQSGAGVILESLPSAEEVVSTLRGGLAHAATLRGDRPFVFERECTVENISYSYDGGVAALEGVAFRIHKGENIGIIGPSGAGKTTLVDLLLGLLAPSAGRIAFDGIDSHAISRSEWRRKVIYVAQEVFLRNDTIAENIRFYDPTISDDAIREACRKANIDGLIASLPKGLATTVGERGTRLSGGERQRIAIARALVRAPAMLIFDEATSALDAESERAIKETLARLRGEITVVMIAHRLTTVADADRIIALEKGRIVETGTPAALMHNPDSYFSRALRAASA